MLPLFYTLLHRHISLHVLSMDDLAWWMIKITRYFGYRDGTGGATIFEWFGPETPQQTFSVNDSFAKTPFQIPRLFNPSPVYAKKKNIRSPRLSHPSPILYQQKLQMSETPKPHYRQHQSQSQSQSNILWRRPRCSFMLSTRPKACPHSGHLTERCATCCTLIWRINDAWLLNVSRRVQPPQPHLNEPSDSLG